MGALLLHVLDKRRKIPELLHSRSENLNTSFPVPRHPLALSERAPTVPPKELLALYLTHTFGVAPS